MDTKARQALTDVSAQTEVFFVQCCFPSTETIRTIKDGEPRTATSTLTQLLSSIGRFLGRTENKSPPPCFHHRK